jgi:D-Tyr-tRNAtyr deacylase
VRRGAGLGSTPPRRSTWGRSEQLVERLRSDGLPIATGVFQAHMAVELVNDGPV